MAGLREGSTTLKEQCRRAVETNGVLLERVSKLEGKLEALKEQVDGMDTVSELIDIEQRLREVDNNINEINARLDSEDALAEDIPIGEIPNAPAETITESSDNPEKEE